MSTLDVLALAYLVVGLALAAGWFHITTAPRSALVRSLSAKRPDGTHAEPEPEVRGIADSLLGLRRDHPAAFGIILGIICLVVVLLWPLVAALIVGVLVKIRRARKGR